MPTATASSTDQFTHLPADSNQALGIAQYAIDFLGEGDNAGDPSEAVLTHTNRFMTDAAICGISALALGTNAPTVLRNEALDHPVPTGRSGATVFGSEILVRPEKAILANCAAVREWDSNGTNFGYDPERGNTAGEFGHNDFYSVATAAAQITGADGLKTLKAMVCHDEIRGRLAEVFSLKTYKVDHVVHGDRVGRRLRRNDGRDRRADRVRDRHDRRPLHPVPGDPGRQAVE